MSNGRTCVYLVKEKALSQAWANTLTSKAGGCICQVFVTVRKCPRPSALQGRDVCLVYDSRRMEMMLAPAPHYRQQHGRNVCERDMKPGSEAGVSLVVLLTSS